MSTTANLRCHYCEVEQQPHSALELKAAKEGRLHCYKCGRADFGNRTIFDVVQEIQTNVERLEANMRAFTMELERHIAKVERNDN